MDAATISRIERGSLEPGTRRLHALLGVYGVEPAVVSELAELDLLNARTAKGNIKDLRAEAEREWKSGNAAGAIPAIIGILEATVGNDDQRLERQRALVFCATIARGLGKFALAQAMVDDLLCNAPDDAVVPDALILASSIWRERGSLPVAFALLEHAGRLIPDTDRKRRPRVPHQKAKLFSESKQAGDALAAIDSALAIYPAAEDTLNEGRALVLKAEILEQLARVDDAVTVAREAVAFADKHDHGFVKTHAHLVLGRVLVSAKKPKEALDELRRALASAVLTVDRNAERHAHEYLALAFDALGEGAAAKAERARAKAMEGLVAGSSSNRRGSQRDAARRESGGGVA